MRVQDLHVGCADVDGDDRVVEVAVAAALEVLEADAHDALGGIDRAGRVQDAVVVQRQRLGVGGAVIRVALDLNGLAVKAHEPELGIDGSQPCDLAVGIAELEVAVGHLREVILRRAVGHDEEADLVAGPQIERLAVTGRQVAAAALEAGVRPQHLHLGDLAVDDLVPAERVQVARGLAIECHCALVILIDHQAVEPGDGGAGAATVQDVVAGLARQRVVAAAAIGDIVAAIGIDRVVALSGEEQLVDRASFEGVVLCRPDDGALHEL